MYESDIKGRKVTQATFWKTVEGTEGDEGREADGREWILSGALPGFMVSGPLNTRQNY